MIGEPERQPEESEGWKPPQRTRPTALIRVFRALKRHENRRRRRHKKEAAETDITMARWTRRVGWFTGALVLVGVITAIIFWRQLQAMQEQLTVMETDSAIHREQLSGKIVLNLAKESNTNGWGITPIWRNMGKTDARNVKGWGDSQFFDKHEDFISFDFMNIRKGHAWVIQGETVVPDPNTAPTFLSENVNLDQIWKSIYGVGATIVYGYLEYSDIFKTVYTIRYCRKLNFEYTGGKVSLGLPQKLTLPCERRTQDEAGH